MGINFGKIFGVVTEVGGALNIPGLAQADAIKDAIQASKASPAEKAALAAQLEALKTTTKAATAPVPKGFAEGNRTKMLLIGIASMVLVHFGLPEETANELTQWIAGLVGAGILGDTVRPSTKAPTA